MTYYNLIKSSVNKGRLQVTWILLLLLKPSKLKLFKKSLEQTTFLQKKLKVAGTKCCNKLENKFLRGEKVKKVARFSRDN